MEPPHVARALEMVLPPSERQEPGTADFPLELHFSVFCSQGRGFRAELRDLAWEYPRIHPN